MATPLIGLRDYRAALGAIDAGVEAIRRFLTEYDQLQNADNCSELVYLLRWREEVSSKVSGPMADEPIDPMTLSSGVPEASRFEPDSGSWRCEPSAPTARSSPS
ncbi:hypothetical protein B4Q13_21530 [Lacticaseibacillus rhamnosus]